MLTLLDTLTSFIAPHQCLGCGHDGDLLCAVCLPLLPELQPQCYRCRRTDGGNLTCKNCRRNSPLQHVWIGTTYDGIGEALMKKLKFERALAAANTITRSLADQFGTALPSHALLVPIPTATSRVRQRGYDQSVIIARKLARHTGLPCASLLSRYGQQRQTGSSRKQRLLQLEDAFRVRPKKLQDAKTVILVDDVLTTGATLEMAAKTLKQAGVKHISAITFARAE